MDATNYVTIAERSLDPKDYPGISPESLVPRSGVFLHLLNRSALMILFNGRVYTGANGKHPFGPESNIERKANDLVVHVSYHYAIAFAEWAGKGLPPEAEWEYVAQGNRPGLNYY